MNRKLIWKFNIIDLLLLAIFLVCLLALVYKLAWGKNTEDTETFLFTCVCPSAPAEILEGLETGLPCMDGDYGNTLGTLTHLQQHPAEDDPSRQLVTFSFRVEGKKADHGVLAEDTLYLKGKNFSLVIEDSIFSVYLSKIEKTNYP